MARPSIVHLNVTLANTTYVLGTLSFKATEDECSYHFMYPKDAPEIHTYCDTGEHTGRLDHITWHKDCVHIKRIDRIAIERIDLSSAPLFSCEPVITPIYVESLYFVANKPCLREAHNFKTFQGSQSQEILNLNQSDGFSIIFMLIPAKMDTPSVLMGMQFAETPKHLCSPPCLADVCDMNHLPGRIQLWNGWALLVIASPLRCRILSPVPAILGNSYRLPNYGNVQASLTDLIMQATNLTKQNVLGL